MAKCTRIRSREMTGFGDNPLWCPKCGRREYTCDPAGAIGFSHTDVICDACGERYSLAVNVGAWLARNEVLEQERQP